MFWSTLSDVDRESLRTSGTQRRYDAGSVLFHEGDRPTHAMVMLDGRVKIVRTAADGRDTIIELRGTGDLLGELGPFDERPRIARAVAIDDIEVLLIPGARFRSLLVNNGRIAVAVLVAVSHKLRQASDYRLKSGTSGTLARLSQRLVELAETEPGLTGNEVVIQSLFTQQELAEWIGVSREAIVLALRELRERGLIETGRRTIRILDLDGLRRLAA